MSPYALKGQKLLAQGNALVVRSYTHTPCKGKSFKIWIIKLLPLQGALLFLFIPRALPWAKSFCPFRAWGQKLRFTSSTQDLPQTWWSCPSTLATALQSP